MAVDANRGTMVSRSVRLHEDTLEKLEKLAKDQGLGVTVLMREILEKHLASPVFELPQAEEPPAPPFSVFDNRPVVE